MRLWDQVRLWDVVIRDAYTNQENSRTVTIAATEAGAKALVPTTTREIAIATPRKVAR